MTAGKADYLKERERALTHKDFDLETIWLAKKRIFMQFLITFSGLPNIISPQKLYTFS